MSQQEITFRNNAQAQPRLWLSFCFAVNLTSTFCDKQYARVSVTRCQILTINVIGSIISSWFQCYYRNRMCWSSRNNYLVTSSKYSHEQKLGKTIKPSMRMEQHKTWILYSQLSYNQLKMPHTKICSWYSRIHSFEVKLIIFLRLYNI